MHSSIFSTLSKFPDQLEELYASFPAAYTHWAPASWEGIPSETFTAIEQICHIRDIEIDGYHLRLHRLLNEEAPSLVSIDSYQVTRDSNYADASVDEVFASFREARATTLNVIESLTESQWRRSGFFEGYGPVTVNGLVHFLCSHDQQHLAGLHWLLGQIASMESVSTPNVV